MLTYGSGVVPQTLAPAKRIEAGQVVAALGEGEKIAVERRRREARKTAQNGGRMHATRRHALQAPRLQLGSACVEAATEQRTPQYGFECARILQPTLRAAEDETAPCNEARQTVGRSQGVGTLVPKRFPTQLLDFVGGQTGWQLVQRHVQALLAAPRRSRRSSFCFAARRSLWRG